MGQIDFEVVRDRVNELEDYLLDGRKTVEQVADSGMLEGYLIIATQAERNSNAPKNEEGAMLLEVPNAMIISGGFFDPVTHQLAILMLEQPIMYARLIYWMDKERNEQQK